jgi:hypothetical protein
MKKFKGVPHKCNAWNDAQYKALYLLAKYREIGVPKGVVTIIAQYVYYNPVGEGTKHGDWTAIYDNSIQALCWKKQKGDTLPACTICYRVCYNWPYKKECCPGCPIHGSYMGICKYCRTRGIKNLNSGFCVQCENGIQNTITLERYHLWERHMYIFQPSTERKTSWTLATGFDLFNQALPANIANYIEKWCRFKA